MPAQRIMIALALSLTAVFVAGRAEADRTSELATSVRSEASPVAAVCVCSPWGYTAYYNVCRGWNTLVCAGTGRTFSYYYR